MHTRGTLCRSQLRSAVMQQQCTMLQTACLAEWLQSEGAWHCGRSAEPWHTGSKPLPLCNLLRLHQIGDRSNVMTSLQSLNGTTP